MITIKKLTTIIGAASALIACASLETPAANDARKIAEVCGGGHAVDIASAVVEFLIDSTRKRLSRDKVREQFAVLSENMAKQHGAEAVQCVFENLHDEVVEEYLKSRHE